METEQGVNQRSLAGAVRSQQADCSSTQLAAQNQNVHYRYQGNEPPGAIGSWQLLRGGPLPGYFQPVEIKAPQGALVSLAVDGTFLPSIPAPVRVGMGRDCTQSRRRVQEQLLTTF